MKAELGGRDQPAPHVIRLRGPWEGPAGRVKLPCEWQSGLGSLAQGTLTRRFNRPANLNAGERVLLRVESPHTIAGVRVNAAEVTLAGDTADITPLLQEANRLIVELSRVDLSRAEPSPVDAIQGSLLDVQLEIVAPGFAGG